MSNLNRKLNKRAKRLEDKRKGVTDVVHLKCPACGHHKARKKEGEGYVCTKCRVIYSEPGTIGSPIEKDIKGNKKSWWRFW